MEQRHKQRLIGAVVVVALAVIFLPMLLQGPVDHGTTDVPMELPERPASPDPAAEATGDPLPEAVRDREETPEAALPEDEAVPEPEVAAEDDPTAVTPEEAPDATDNAADGSGEAAPETGPNAPGSYAVQVGSFGNRDNAIGLRDRLRGQDFSAYVEEVEGDERTLYRLRVGPVMERDAAETLADELQSRADLEGLVVSHP